MVANWHKQATIQLKSILPLCHSVFSRTSPNPLENVDSVVVSIAIA